MNDLGTRLRHFVTKNVQSHYYPYCCNAVNPVAVTGWPVMHLIGMHLDSLAISNTYAPVQILKKKPIKVHNFFAWA